MSAKRPLGSIENQTGWERSNDDDDSKESAMSTSKRADLIDKVNEKENEKTEWSKYTCIALLDENAENESLKWEERTAVITRFDHENYVLWANDIVHQIVDDATDHSHVKQPGQHDAAKAESLQCEESQSISLQQGMHTDSTALESINVDGDQDAQFVKCKERGIEACPPVTKPKEGEVAMDGLRTTKTLLRASHQVEAPTKSATEEVPKLGVIDRDVSCAEPVEVNSESSEAPTCEVIESSSDQPQLASHLEEDVTTGPLKEGSHTEGEGHLEQDLESGTATYQLEVETKEQGGLLTIEERQVHGTTDTEVDSEAAFMPPGPNVVKEVFAESQPTIAQKIDDLQSSKVISKKAPQGITRPAEDPDNEVFHSGTSETDDSSGDGDSKNDNKTERFLKPVGFKAGNFEQHGEEPFFSVSSRLSMDGEEPMEISFAATPIKRQNFDVEMAIRQQQSSSDSESDAYASAEQSFASSSKSNSNNVTIEEVNDEDSNIKSTEVDDEANSNNRRKTGDVSAGHNEQSMSDVLDAMASLVLQSTQKSQKMKRNTPFHLQLSSAPLHCRFEDVDNPDSTPDFEKQEEMVLQWEKNQQDKDSPTTQRSKLVMTVSSSDLIDHPVPTTRSTTDRMASEMKAATEPTTSTEATNCIKESASASSNMSECSTAATEPSIVVVSSSSSVPEHLLSELQILEKDKKIASLLREIEAQKQSMTSFQAECNALDASQAEIMATMKAYETTIEEIGQQAQREQVLRDIKIEDDLKALAQAQEDLNNAEQAFNDVSSKNERAKEAITGFLRMEQERERMIEKLRTKAEKAEERYERLKFHAETKVEEANEGYQKAKEKHEVKLAQMRARLRKAELEMGSLETTLKEKDDEKLELTKLYDELVAKRASAMFEKPLQHF